MNENKTSFIIKGDICWNIAPDKLKTVRNGYLICENGVSAGVFRKIPNKYMHLPLKNYDGMIVTPGMVDLHIHAPQYPYRGLGMDLELLDWLQTYAFPEEAKYSNMHYADEAYSFFVNALLHSGTTRACLFGTRHAEATILLMDILEKSGLNTYVGKVNMDQDAPENLREKSAMESTQETLKWLYEAAGRYSHTKAILTPRFLPSCTHDLLEKLQKIEKEFKLPVQSHLSENPGEVELVHKLFPENDFYGQGYENYDMFGSLGKSVMAHCVWSTDEEIALMKKRGVFVAHCPASNINLASGIAPIRKYMDLGLNIGLGSDVAGGETESMYRAIVNAIQVSKLYWRLVDDSCKPLTFDEAFYLATIGGGKFFGKVGSFDEGYEFDAIVIDDNDTRFAALSLYERLQKAVYLGSDKGKLVGKFVQGRQIV